MSVNLDNLKWLVTITLGVAIAGLSHLLSSVPPLARPELGPRGLQRAKALELGGFAMLEPGMRWLGALLALIPLPRLRPLLAHKLLQAGDYLGLCADEVLALTVIGTTAGAVLGSIVCEFLYLGLGWHLFATVLGAALPWSYVQAQIKTRALGISRGLPPAIDLLSLCVGAGLDLVGALELLVRELKDAKNPVGPELERVLSELALGRTRREALTDLGARVPVEAMSDFANALIQAELKGTPLAEAVEIKARVMRMRRSVLAEEAASRASVLLALPMVLMLAAILLMMLGPLLINGLGI
jgi:tight adherence protein C